jgi:hypothetical protein
MQAPALSWSKARGAAVHACTLRFVDSGSGREPLFPSNPVEARIALSQAGRLALALGFVQALDAYFHQGRAG